MNRPDINTYFMQVAQVAATRSTCSRRAVGAALVRGKHIVSTGYNGAPPGLAHCDPCLMLPEVQHCLQTVHAEVNALLHAATRQPGDVLYCTDQPCLACLKAALSAGVACIWYDRPYPSAERDLFVEYNKLEYYMIHYHDKSRLD